MGKVGIFFAILEYFYIFLKKFFISLRNNLSIFASLFYSMQDLKKLRLIAKNMRYGNPDETLGDLSKIS